MKLVNELKWLLLLGICAGMLATTPTSASASAGSPQQIDTTKGNSTPSEVSKDENPPKPPPKPGPRDGGADD